MRKRIFSFLLGLVFLACPVPPAFAHKASDSYLNLKIEAERFFGEWEIALRDLEYAVGLDSNGDGKITWGEVKARFPEIDACALGGLTLSVEGKPAPFVIHERLIENHSDGAYLLLKFSGPIQAGARHVGVHYSLFFDLDPQHRGLLKVASTETIQSYVFSPDQRDFVFEPGIRPIHFTVNFLREGIHHIWFGFDHILFLLALLLPAVTSGNGESFRVVLVRVLKIVTAFTVAHSVTLSIAALGLLNPPSRLIESAIAFSVILAAVNNLRPIFREKSWMVAFGFGLVHGFGFASALREAGLEKSNLAFPLFGFNAGVELGQLAIVALFLPMAFILRRTWFYQRVSLQLGSGFIALIAAVWMTERLLNLKLMPF